ncbi:MAG: hypothetical protein ACI9EW_002008 [Cellvibrionaceae bacterium]|jgi:hypothetical protein
MAEIEGEPIKITLEDIEAASQLSLACPMCAGPVYREYNDPEMAPVECANCETIYHRACWEQSGGKCAMVGCDCKRIKVYNHISAPVSVSIQSTDIRERGPEITEELKRQQQRMRREFESGSLLGRFMRWLWDQIKIG